MEINKYKSSRKGIKATVIFFVLFILVVIVVAPGPKTTPKDFFEMVAGFIALFSALTFMLWASYIEIDDEKRTIIPIFRTLFKK